MPPVKRATSLAPIDEELFRAWRSGDADAREEAWNRLWRVYYSAAVGFCRNFGQGDAARGLALDAIASACLDLERTLSGDFRWSGEPEFTKLVRTYLFNRCRDACRAELRWSRRRNDLPGANDDDNGDEKLEAMLPVEPTQESSRLAVARTREAIDDLIVKLAARREICRSRPALAAVLDAELEYVRECIARTVTGVDPGVAAGMTIDELIPHMHRDRFEASAAEMSQFVMTRLDINRNTLDLRQQRIARAVRGRLGDEPDAAAAAV